MSRVPHLHTHNCGCADEAKGPGELSSLYGAVLMDNVRCLNEAKKDTGKTIIKPYDQRLDNTATVESDCDGELIFVIPFNVNVKLTAITIRGADGAGRAPTRMKLWINREDIDFTTASEVKPTQEMNIAFDERAEMKYQVKLSLFSSVSTLTIMLDRCDSDSMSLGYIGMFGQFTKEKRQIVNVVYEAKPNPADHPKTEEQLRGHHSVL